MKAIDPSDPLDALLRAPSGDLPDAGFSAAVMRRVRALPPAPKPVQTLRGLERGLARSQRAQRYSMVGLAVGATFALAWWAAAGGTAVDIGDRGAALALALAVSGAALAWSLLSEPA